MLLMASKVFISDTNHGVYRNGGMQRGIPLIPRLMIGNSLLIQQVKVTMFGLVRMMYFYQEVILETIVLLVQMRLFLVL